MSGEIHKQYNLLVKDMAKLGDCGRYVNAFYLSANPILLGDVARAVRARS